MWLFIIGWLITGAIGSVLNMGYAFYKETRTFIDVGDIVELTVMAVVGGSIYLILTTVAIATDYIKTNRLMKKIVYEKKD